MNKPKTRDSNLELLRIFAMLLIVVSHYCVHNNFVIKEANDFSRILLQFLSLGNVGTNLFIMLSGYFYTSFKNPLKKIIRLKLEMFFHMFLILIILSSLKLIIPDKKIIFINLFPILTEQYWFMTTYFLLLIICPFINFILKKINKIQFTFLLVIYFIIISLVPTIFNNFFGILRIFEFIFLYLIGAYIYKFNYKLKNHNKFSIIGFILILMSSLCMVLNINYENSLNINIFYLHHRMHILSLAMALGFFIIFKNINIRNNKYINLISECTLGIYLIHENPPIRMLFWKNLFIGNSIKNTIYLIPHLFISVIIVFFISFLVSFFYKNLEKFILRKLKKI